MAGSSKLGALSVEIVGDLKKYYAATAEAKKLTEKTGNEMSSSFLAAGSRAASGFASAFQTVGGKVLKFVAPDGITVQYGAAGNQASSAFVQGFMAAQQGVAAKTAPPPTVGVWTKAGNDAVKAFANAFLQIRNMIIKKILIVAGATVIAAAFAASGLKSAEFFARAFNGLAKSITSPLGKAMAAGTIGLIFGVAGAKAAIAFGKAFATVGVGVLKAVAKVGVDVVKAFVSIGRRAANAFGRTLRAGLMVAMNPGTLMAGLAGGAVLGGITFGFSKVIMAASNLNETINKVKETFHGATGIVTAGADEMAKKFGVPTRQFLDAASSIGLIAKGAKLSDEASAKLGVDLGKAAADASSFYNVSLEDALTAMRAGLVGESEPLRRFGILLDEDSVKIEAMRMGLAKNAHELTQSMKVQARASLIMAGMKTASGDLERTQGGLANRLREIRGRFENLAAQIGQYFLPAVEAASKIIADFATTLGSKIEGSAGVFSGWGAALSSVVEKAGFLFSQIKGIYALLFTSSKNAPWGLAFEQVAKTFQDIFGWLINQLVKAFDYMGQVISSSINKALFGVLRVLGDNLPAFMGKASFSNAADEMAFGGALAAPKMPGFDPFPIVEALKPIADGIKALIKLETAFQAGQIAGRALAKAGGLWDQAGKKLMARGGGAAGADDNKQAMALLDMADKRRKPAPLNQAEQARIDRLGIKPPKPADALGMIKADQAEAAARAKRIQANLNANFGVQEGGWKLPPGVNKQLNEQRKLMAKKMALTPEEKQMRDIDRRIDLLRKGAEAKGPDGLPTKEAKAQQKNVEELMAARKDLLAGAKQPGGRDTGAGQTFGFEDLANHIQQSIFSSGSDPAEQTAKNTDVMARILGLLETNGLAIKGNMVAIAAG